MSLSSITPLLNPESRHSSLYTIVQDFAALIEWMDEHADELDTDPNVIPEVLAQLQIRAEDPATTQIERLALLIRALHQKADVAHRQKAALQAELEFYTARELRLERQAEFLKRHVVQCFARLGISRVDGEMLTVRAHANSEPSVRATLDSHTLSELHEHRNPFVTAECQYRLDVAAILGLYQAIVANEPIPSAGIPCHRERLAAWERHVHAALYMAGVPQGVRIVRGVHLRIE